MKTGVNFYCVIPARLGSKGIKEKNIAPFMGKPLIEWTIRAAIESNCFDRVLVSTESEKIKHMAEAAGAECPFLRPDKLARDDVHASQAVMQMVEKLEEKDDRPIQNLCMLLPTAPLRTAKDISDARDLFFEQDAPSLVSVVETGKYLNNFRFLRKGILVDAVAGQRPNVQRQELEKVYAVNGSIFMAKTPVLKEYKTFHVENTVGFEMDFTHSVDINSTQDVRLAEQLYLGANALEGEEN